MGYAQKRGWEDALGAGGQGYHMQPTSGGDQVLSNEISHMVSPHPTCTLLVGDLPPGCSDHVLSGIFGRYGEVKGVSVIYNGQTALVHFRDASTPTRLVQMARVNPFCVGPNRVRLEFAVDPPTRPSAPEHQTAEPVTSRILHLDIASADYPITVDVIKSICQPHGKLVRIFIGKKNVDRSIQAVVEFDTVEEAAQAKTHLDGADIYSGCCSLTVTFSKLQRVHVTQNSTESWDFTGANANMEGPLANSSSQRTLLRSAQVPQAPVAASAGAAITAPPFPYPSPVQMPGPNVPPVMVPPYQSQTPATYYTAPPYSAPSMYAPPGGPAVPPYAAVYNPPPPSSTPTVPRPVRASTTVVPIKQFKQVTVLPTPVTVHQVNSSGIGVGHATSSSNTYPVTVSQSDLSLFEAVEGVVLMASNLPRKLNCDHLFNLLCVYGNIARIKFLKSRPGCAMVQVGNAEASDFIHRYFNGITIFGHAIQFHHSKQAQLTEHENLGTLDDGSPVMKNYMMDPNNRFRNAVVAAKSRILEPSRTLHFFNAPLNLNPEDLCRVFVDAGASSPPRIILFSPKPGQKTSLGLAEWDTLSDALEALVLANQRPIHISGIVHPFHLKLAFSPKPISTEHGGIALIRYPAPPVDASQKANDAGSINNGMNACPPEEEDEEDFKENGSNADDSATRYDFRSTDSSERDKEGN